MTSGFVPAMKSLDDPLVLDWVFRRIDHAHQVGNTERERELTTLLTDDRLKSSLEDPRLTRRMLDCLPLERFGSLEDDLAGVFPSWRGAMARDGAKILAGIAPARFIEAASRELAADSFDVEGRVTALAESLGALGPPAAGPARQLYWSYQYLDTTAFSG